MSLTHDEARTAARIIADQIGPAGIARLRVLAAGPRPYRSIDATLTGTRYVDGSRRRVLVHQFGGSDLRRHGRGIEPVLTALTPLGRAVVDLTAEEAQR